MKPRKAFVVPEARGPMIGRNLIRNCLLVTITSLTLAMAAPGQERTENVLTLDQAIELARSHNRELKQAGLEIHKQQEAFRFRVRPVSTLGCAIAPTRSLDPRL